MPRWRWEPTFEKQKGFRTPQRRGARQSAVRVFRHPTYRHIEDPYAVSVRRSPVSDLRTNSAAARSPSLWRSSPQAKVVHDEDPRRLFDHELVQLREDGALLDEVEGMLRLVDQLVQLQVDERHVMFTDVGDTDLEWKKLPKGTFG